MGAVWYRFRTELRRRAAPWLATAALVGLAVGAVAGTAAGARRTASTDDRYAQWSRSADLLVDVGFLDLAEVDRTRDMLASLPGVDAAAEVGGLVVYEGPLESLRPAAADTEVVGVDERYGRDVDRPVVVAGAVPAPSAMAATADANYLARTGRRLGDTVRLTTLSPGFEVLVGDDLSDAVAMARRDPSRRRTAEVRIDAEVRPARDVAQDDVADLGTLTLTAAATEELGRDGVLILVALRFEEGVDATRAREQVAAVLEDQPFDVTARSVTEERADDAVAPVVAALWTVTALLALVATVVLGGVLVRQAALDGSDDGRLRGLGWSTRQLAGLTALRGAAVACPAAAVSVAVAVAISPLFPLGPLRGFEPDSGVAVDTTVLAAAVLFVLVVVPGLVVGLRHTTSEPAALGGVASDRLGLGVRWPAVMVGLALALPRSRALRAPTRSAYLSLSCGVVALAAVLTVAVTMDRLTDSPREQGWAWDLAVGGGYGSLDPNMDDLLASIPQVRSWTYGAFEEVRIGDEDVPVQALRPVEGPSRLVITDGREVRAADEVVLGGATMDRLGLNVGDPVAIEGDLHTRRFRIVGRAVLPAVGRGDSPRPGLGTGAVFSFRGLSSVAGATEPTAVLLEVEPGRVPDVAGRLVQGFGPGGSPVLAPQLSGQLRAWDALEWLPVAVAVLIAALTVASLVHVLILTTRRAGTDIAVVRALGVSAREVTAGVVLQGVTLMGVALAIGLVLGSGAGRLGWRALGNELGVTLEVVVPGLALATTAVGAMTVAAAAALAPGRRVGRPPPAVSLRSP
jgi:hypothetical protein